MLINALCDYYDILVKGGKLFPEAYSKVKIHYLIVLTPEGTMKDLIDCQEIETRPAGKNKTRDVKVPKFMKFPRRTEKTSIDANIVEHRPLYLFGLNLEKGKLTTEDRTQKARKSHADFVKKSLDFTENMHSDLVSAFRKFILSWDPEKETENPLLQKLGNEYQTSGYAFCLAGKPNQTLNQDPELLEKWERCYEQEDTEAQKEKVQQCAVIGEMLPIARVHNKIKGLAGGKSTGAVLISYKNASERSYGNDMSYNSSISIKAMKKYTEALNYLLEDKKHFILMDDMTILFWAMDKSGACESTFLQVLNPSGKTDAEATEIMLQEVWEAGKKGTLREERLTDSQSHIDEDVDFYMMGLKANAARISVKFLVRKKFADILYNIADFQKEAKMGSKMPLISLMDIRNELVSPKSSIEKVNPALMVDVFQALIYGGRFPVALLDTMVRRYKTDAGAEEIDSFREWKRAAIIKAIINRNDKEDLKMGLDKTNHDQAYLCGRLFAVLERLQRDASGGKLNRTIKDAYFSSGASKPGVVFPKLIKLAQNHLNSPKVKYPEYYNKLIGEIINQLNGEFPQTLFLKEQGKFIVGYYQQVQDFFTRKSDGKAEVESSGEDIQEETQE